MENNKDMSKFVLRKSNIHVFNQCLYKFKLLCIDNVTVDSKSPALQKGTDVHLIFDQFYDFNGNLDEMIANIRKHSNYEKYKIEVENFIKFNQSLAKHGFSRPSYKEQLMFDKELNLQGTLDFLDVGDGYSIVVDYKTGKEKDIKDFEFELGVYSHLSEKTFNKKITHIGIFFATTGKFVIAECTEGIIKKSIDEVKRVRQLLNSDLVYKKQPNKYCWNCEFFRNKMCNAIEDAA